MAVMDPEGAERHTRDAEFTRARAAKWATEPVLYKVYAEKPAPDPEAEVKPARRRITKRKR